MFWLYFIVLDAENGKPANNEAAGEVFWDYPRKLVGTAMKNSYGLKRTINFRGSGMFITDSYGLKLDLVKLENLSVVH